MRSVEKGMWQKTKNFCLFDYSVFELKGKVLCIFGKGATGSEVARLATAFGLKVYFAERKHSAKVRQGYIDFDQALKMADIVSLHLPLNEETQSLFSTREFALMKPSAFLVNVARGQIVDQQALVVALKEKKIAGAALDVIDREPPSIEIEKHPLLKEIANDSCNLVVSPHIAWLGSQSIATLLGQCMENIEQFHKGTPVRTV
uniref:D-isomer specific 2-hydroxyacid dehydrogenase NAD-binding domain-containing protein n=1 Tax=Magallana gigas TaxID=29159 RepID=K1Q400_MAGGI